MEEKVDLFQTKFSGIYKIIFEKETEKIATENLIPSKNVYGERLIKKGEKEYRIWDPFRSKLCAAILRKMKQLPIKPGSKVLYLGSASGTTASHISDIVGKDGYVFCIEFSPRSIRDLINNVCRYRDNMAPILADARFPRSYSTLVGKVEVIYCDIAQPEQAKIAVNNAEVFLEEKGWIIFLIKARSIDVTKKPSEVFQLETLVLKKNGFRIFQSINLEPYEKDHEMIIAEYLP
jgi:fibrillarin-like pre-rRNA processing protein